MATTILQGILGGILTVVVLCMLLYSSNKSETYTPTIHTHTHNTRRKLSSTDVSFVLRDPSSILHNLPKWSKCVKRILHIQETKNAFSNPDPYIHCLDTSDPQIFQYVYSQVMENKVENLPHIEASMPPVLPQDFDIYNFVSSRGKLINKGRTADGDGGASKGRTIYITRMVHNNLYPLQDVDYNRRAVMQTLLQEPPINQVTDDNGSQWRVNRLWIVNRILNGTESQLALHTLRLFNELYYTIPLDLSMTPLLYRHGDYFLNEVACRATALRESIAMGARWIILLDAGFVFRPDTIAAVFRNIIDADAVGTRVVYIPAFNMYEDVDKMADIGVSKLRPTNPQLAIRFDAPNLLNRHAHKSGKNITQSRLCDNIHAQTLNEAFTMTKGVCEKEVLKMAEKDKYNKSGFQDIIKKCGGVFKLPYSEKEKSGEKLKADKQERREECATSAAESIKIFERIAETVSYTYTAHKLANDE